MAEEWRLITNEPFTAAMNMAVDEAIMTAVAQGKAPPTIRFYRWNPPAVSLGFFQSLSKEVDVEACREAGVDVVRRLTGGRAVLHCHELTYSLVAPESNPIVAGSILQSYLSVSRGLLTGLTNLGVKAELSEGKKQTAFNSAACFDAPSWYELVVGGRKLVGSAQTRRNGCVLQHGSVLIRLNADLLFSVLHFNDCKVRERAKTTFSAKATALEDILGYTPDFDRLCGCFGDGFATVLKINLSEGHLSVEETELARELSVNKYSDQNWNGRK